MGGQQLGPPTGDEHDHRRQCHRQHDILGAFAKLAADVGPALDGEVMGLIADFQQQDRQPGQAAGGASPQDQRRQQEQDESDKDVQGVHADARCMLDE